MICANCKAVISEDFEFCPKCGARRAANAETKCWKCGKTINTADSFCRYCGIGQGKHVPFCYTHFGVWLLFIFILPFALIFVWRSPVIKKPVKWVYTFLMLALTCWFCYSFYMAVHKVFAEYESVFNLTI